jgi:ATP-dependent DNA ligase
MLPFIAPDKPIRTSDDFLIDLDVEEWSCEMKLDGYRMEISKHDGIIIARSRHNEILKIDGSFIDYFNSLLSEGSAIDTEWINHDRIKAINTVMKFNLPLVECIGIHDVTWLNGKYLGNISLKERRNCDIYKKLQTASMNNIIDNFKVFKIPMLSDDNTMIDFYNMQKSIKISEGIVIKKWNSKLVGNRSQSAKNPSWYKIKYRN